MINLKNKILIDKEEYENLINLAYKDPLTKIYNRTGMFKLIKEKIKETSQVTLWLVDIKNLHNVNKQYGHESGDTLIKFISTLLRKDNSVRWGGDEFLILCIDNNLESSTIEKRSKEIDAKVKNELPNFNSGIHWGISEGYISKNNIEEDLNELIKKAEEHMNSKKQTEIRL